MRNLIEKLTCYFAQYKWAHKYLKPIWNKLYTEPRIRKRRNLFLNNGIELMTNFNSIMTKHGHSYSLIFGTLLGAVREHGFIKHDLDIDVAIWHDADNKQIEHILIQGGFNLVRRIEVENGILGREETYIYKGVSIDLFYFYPYNTNLMYCNVFLPFEGCRNFDESINKYGGLLPLQLILPLSREIEYITFENIQMPIPKNAEAFLEARYGKNWRIPDPTFVYPKMGEALFKIWNDKIGIITHI